MQIIRDIKYLKKLQSIMEYIATDSIFGAIQFQIDLDELTNKYMNNLDT